MRKISCFALAVAAAAVITAAPTGAQTLHHGRFVHGTPVNQPPQDPYRFDNYNHVSGIRDVTTTSQTTNAAGQPITSTTTTYDRDQFGHHGAKFHFECGWHTINL